MIWVELVFLMFVLKIPVIYVCWLVWWAVRQEPEPPRDAVAVRAQAGGPDGSEAPRRRPSGPHGRPRRTAARTPRPAAARASATARRVSP